jgi:type IV pilus assembly protein PilP
VRWLQITLCATVLVGCGSSGTEDLQAWMQTQRMDTRPRVTPIPAPKKFVPQPYTEERSVDPFSSQKLTQALRNEMGQPSNSVLIAAELNRRKEALEYFPLDTMTMVGSLIKKGLPVALVKADNLLYQVKVGSYLGQNYGKVIKVSETELNMREIVQDAGGEWIERPTTLQLQEGTK